MEPKTEDSQYFFCSDMDGKIYARTKTFDDNLYVDVRTFLDQPIRQNLFPPEDGYALI